MRTHCLRCYASLNCFILFMHSSLRLVCSLWFEHVQGLFKSAKLEKGFWYVHACVCMQQMCTVAWLSGVEMNEALISTSLYLMWQAMIGWATLQSQIASAETGHDGRRDKVMKGGRMERQCKTSRNKRGKIKKLRFLKTRKRKDIDKWNKRRAVCCWWIPASQMRRYVMLMFPDNREASQGPKTICGPSLSSHKTAPPLCCCGIQVISSLIHSRAPN